MLKLRLHQSPPSANRAWRMFRGHMTRSAEYKKWEKAAIDTFEKSKADRLPDLCYWRTEIYIPRNETRFDLDNMIKPVHDAIVRAGLTPDDRYLVKTTVSFWEGSHLLIYVHHERLDLWQKIMKPSAKILRRIQKALNLTLPI